MVLEGMEISQKKIGIEIERRGRRDESSSEDQKGKGEVIPHLFIPLVQDIHSTKV